MPDSSQDSPEQEPKKPSLKTLATDKTGALHPDDSVAAAGERMREHDTNKWPVAEERKLVGMVEEKNPDWQIGGRGHDPNSWTVGQIMTNETVFCFEDEDCLHAREIMEERKVNYIPVVDRDMRIVAIFSREEIDRRLAEQSQAGKPS